VLSAGAGSRKRGGVCFIPNSGRAGRRPWRLGWADFVAEVGSGGEMGRHGAILKSGRAPRCRCSGQGGDAPVSTPTTPPSRNARDQLIRRRPCGQLGEPTQVLCDGREGEFELGAAGAPETQSDETQDALQVGEQHLDLFTITA
jgi:hypothetical protein